MPMQVQVMQPKNVFSISSQVAEMNYVKKKTNKQKNTHLKSSRVITFFATWSGQTSFQNRKNITSHQIFTFRRNFFSSFLIINCESVKESSTRPWHWCAPPVLAGQMVCLVGYLRENQEFKSFSHCSLHWLHTNECLAKAFNLEPNCLHTQRGQAVEPWNSGSGPVKGGCNPLYFRVIGYNHFMVCWTGLLLRCCFDAFYCDIYIYI